MRKYLIGLFIIYIFCISLVSAFNYEYIYKNISYQKPIYKEKIIEVKPVYFATNKTWSKTRSYIETEKIDEKTIYKKGEIIGVKIDDKIINHHNFNIVGNKFIEWSVPIGDRNMDLFGDCDSDELRIGVCKEEMLI